MRARYYNIDIKRFINQDILTGSIDSSKSLNRYAYVEGNPISYLDPFGLKKQEQDRIDTSPAHIAITVFNVAGFVAGLGLLASGNIVAMLNWVDFYCFISNLLTAIDALLYCYDWITARNEQEKSDAEKGFISCAASYFVPGTISKVTDMKIVLKGFEYDIAKTLLGFTLGAFGGLTDFVMSHISKTE